MASRKFLLITRYIAVHTEYHLLRQFALPSELEEINASLFEIQNGDSMELTPLTFKSRNILETFNGLELENLAQHH